MAHCCHVVDAVQVLVASLVIQVAALATHDVQRLLVAQCCIFAIVLAAHLQDIAAAAAGLIRHGEYCNSRGWLLGRLQLGLLHGSAGVLQHVEICVDTFIA